MAAATSLTRPQRLAPGLWRLTLPSDTLPPYHHTHVHVVADAGVAVVVDPGFREPARVRDLEAALADAGASLVKAVLLTHGHRDHLAGLPALVERWSDVDVLAHPREHERIAPFAAGARVRALQDGRRLTVGGAVLEALHTPGHAPGHLALLLPELRWALSGDLVVADGSTWVGRPDGDVDAYLASLQRLAARDPARLAPSHGPVIEAPAERLRAAAEHRLAREREILAALERPARLEALRLAIYPELEPATWPMAEASLLAHLDKLRADGKVEQASADDRGPFRRRA